ncbi:hypothetical protein EII34_04810 [Arachnia propionica]|uniref:Low temperature requirement protein A n=1 Tax=Arachnia propionica TaxID=1750 RepID=A0A3P1T975_9ACTN|nr:low temperature requirement protein A [Arachnia propionica]RRD06007.1 hypothetical protein EII34_04810 [Arachnia propionica]
MVERDDEEPNRVATTLELLYDLTLVVAFGVAGAEFAHAIAAGHVLPGLVAFCIVQFATVWAWMNYSWFASAFDTDDWGVRLCVGFQMVGATSRDICAPALRSPVVANCRKTDLSRPLGRSGGADRPAGFGGDAGSRLGLLRRRPQVTIVSIPVMEPAQVTAKPAGEHLPAPRHRHGALFVSGVDGGHRNGRRPNGEAGEGCQGRRAE